MRLKLHDEIAIRCLVTIIISVLNQFFLVKNGMTCSDYGQTKAQFGAGANLLLARTAGCEIYSTLEVLPALLAVIVKYASSCELPGVAVMTCFAWFPSLPEMIVILIVGVLLFGRRLPEVGRYLGKGIVEFKKGLKGIEDDVESVSHAPAQQNYQQPEPPKPPQRIAASAPKFQEPAAAPAATVDSEGKERYQA
jgi:sec-independent protein translocase protein TatA